MAEGNIEKVDIVQTWDITAPSDRYTISNISNNKLCKTGNIVYCTAEFIVSTSTTNNAYIDGWFSFPKFGRTVSNLYGTWMDETKSESGILVSSNNTNIWFRNSSGNNMNLSDRIGDKFYVVVTYAIY